ncbi:MAG TPA: hypothetical protein PKY56_06270 [Candidatus Kapabacteria bacterium]|nr:hypothetical protein [Candidatus Kapabacteria bacterium]HPO61483.1 hypothetical protein [Candidatus Kapabacteria bacterium]
MKAKILSILILIFAVTYANSQTADMIIGKAINAVGGEKSFKSINSIEYVMVLTGMGMEMPMKYYKKGDDKIRLEISYMGQDMISVLNGKSAWTKTAGNVIEVPEAALNEFKGQLESQVEAFDMPFINYKEKNITFELIGEEPVNGIDAYKIEATSADGNSTLYIDKATNFLIKATSVQNINGQNIDADVFMSDYKPVGSLKMPHKIEVKSNGEDLVKIVLNTLKINEKIDDSMFQKP